MCDDEAWPVGAAWAYNEWTLRLDDTTAFAVAASGEVLLLSTRNAGSTTANYELYAPGGTLVSSFVEDVDGWRTFGLADATLNGWATVEWRDGWRSPGPGALLSWRSELEPRKWQIEFPDYIDDLAFAPELGIVVAGRDADTLEAWLRGYDEQGTLSWKSMEIFIGNEEAQLDLAIRDDGLVALGDPGHATLVAADSIEALPFAAPKLAWAGQNELYVGELGPGDDPDNADLTRVALTGDTTWQRHHNRALAWNGPMPSREEIIQIAAHPCGGLVALVQSHDEWSETLPDVPTFDCTEGQVSMFFVDAQGEIIAIDRINVCARARDLKIDGAGDIYVLLGEGPAWLRKYSLERLSG